MTPNSFSVREEQPDGSKKRRLLSPEELAENVKHLSERVRVVRVMTKIIIIIIYCIYIAQIPCIIHYWNKVTVHHLKLCYFLMKKDNTIICGVLLNHCLTVNRIISKSRNLYACVVVVKLASTPMMDTHDTEFVN